MLIFDPQADLRDLMLMHSMSTLKQNEFNSDALSNTVAHFFHFFHIFVIALFIEYEKSGQLNLTEHRR